MTCVLATPRRSWDFRCTPCSRHVDRRYTPEVIARRTLAALLLIGLAAPLGGEPPHLGALPPLAPWDGAASRAVLVLPDDPWATPFERSGLVDSPSYDETVAWLRRLVEASPKLAMTSLGRSPEGREIWMVIASADGVATREAVGRSGKAVVLAQAGIHPGEIDGKDAGMMLLRDLTVRGTRAELLDKATFLFVPILSVDGHERRSPYGRINQRGPATTGWRTNARNLNLNRDYAKLDTAEMRALVAAIERWRPDLYLDLHVTDDVDHGYDVTYGWNHAAGWSPSIRALLDGVVRPAIDAALVRAGHAPGPLNLAVDALDPAAGFYDWTATPRFSNGYGDARHLPTILVENHSLKPFDRRVLGAYHLLAETLRLAGEQAAALRSAVAEDAGRRPARVPLGFQVPPGKKPRVPFRGIGHRRTPSPISGGVRIEWTGEPVDVELPLHALAEPIAVADRPVAYWVPAAWPEVIERLAIHGIAMERLAEPREVEVEMLRLVDPVLAAEPFEGHATVKLTKTVAEMRRERFPAGSVRIPTDQPLGDLAVLLLEPLSPDSFFAWGFFLEVLQRTEYGEAYILEPMAERMLAADPALRTEFEAALAADPKLAADPAARLDWFYRRTPYWDGRWRLYPVGRER